MSSGFEDLFTGYSKEKRPLTEYAEVVGLYHLAFVLFLTVAKATGRPLPERIALGDVLLIGTATFKLSRLITKGLATSPLRAAFTSYEGPAGEGEASEKPRGKGKQRVLGELLTCPFCLSAWVAALFAYALILSPPLTRFVATILSIQALADTLQLGYGAAAERVGPKHDL